MAVGLGRRHKSRRCPSPKLHHNTRRIVAFPTQVPVNNGDNPPLPGCAPLRLGYARFVSGLEVEGVGGEIRRLREANGKLTGQGKPAVAHCHGRLKAEG